MDSQIFESIQMIYPFTVNSQKSSLNSEKLCSFCIKLTAFWTPDISRKGPIK